ncbi:MAG: (p)ppGpp synthase/HD superfamily hydrolase [Bradymonadia bacterium]|jgi:(p)ppGpp synthase/HD superfamily hydrolase
MLKSTSEPTIADARAFAIEAHGTQRYGAEPYATHLAEVAGVIDAYLPDHDRHRTLMQAAWLHDTLEDTPAKAGDLRDEGFSDRLIDAVRFCTDVPGPDRKARKRATYRKMRRALNASLAGEGTPGTRLGALVKLADRVANLRATLRSEHERLARTYAGEAEVFRMAVLCPWLPTAMLAEYDGLIDQVRRLA